MLVMPVVHVCRFNWSEADAGPAFANWRVLANDFAVEWYLNRLHRLLQLSPDFFSISEIYAFFAGGTSPAPSLSSSCSNFRFLALLP
jgi:hypothetical protein